MTLIDCSFSVCKQKLTLYIEFLIKCLRPCPLSESSVVVIRCLPYIKRVFSANGPVADRRSSHESKKGPVGILVTFMLHQTGPVGKLVTIMSHQTGPVGYYLSLLCPTKQALLVFTIFFISFHKCYI
jgi:hypothetical protein